MPMLPAGAARSPPATSIAAVSCVVVVLPFVPVTLIHSAGLTLSRRRQASSMSPHTVTEVCSAQSNCGWSG